LGGIIPHHKAEVTVTHVKSMRLVLLDFFVPLVRIDFVHPFSCGIFDTA